MKNPKLKCLIRIRDWIESARIDVPINAKVREAFACSKKKGEKHQTLLLFSHLMGARVGQMGPRAKSVLADAVTLRTMHGPYLRLVIKFSTML